MVILGILAIIATLINIWYSYHERIENFFWNWPAYGLIAAGMFINHAYANAAMQIVQATVATYGFFIWTQHRKWSIKETLISVLYDKHHKDHECPVIATTTMSFKEHIYALLGVLAIFIVVRCILNFVNDISPTVDALSFAVPIIGTILYNHKKVEAWFYYVITNLFSCYLAYQAKNWYNMITVGLLAVLCVLCFKRWLKCMREQSR